RERHTQRCVHTCLDSAFDHTDKCQRTARLSKLLLAPQHSTTAFFCPKVSLSVTHTHTHKHTHTHTHTHTQTELRTHTHIHTHAHTHTPNKHIDMQACGFCNDIFKYACLHTPCTLTHTHTYTHTHTHQINIYTHTCDNDT